MQPHGRNRRKSAKDCVYCAKKGWQLGKKCTNSGRKYDKRNEKDRANARSAEI